jgi:hypothetical protein
MILFMVESGNTHVIVYETGREQAKRAASRWLGDYNGGPDNYIVTPLTAPGDRIHIDLSLAA